MADLQNQSIADHRVIFCLVSAVVRMHGVLFKHIRNTRKRHIPKTTLYSVKMRVCVFDALRALQQSSVIKVSYTKFSYKSQRDIYLISLLSKISRYINFTQL